MKLHKKQQYIYVGLDTHRKTHYACIINCWHEILDSFEFNNKPSEFIMFIEYISQYETDGLTAVYGLEDVNGVGRSLCRFLLSQGKKVKFVNSVLSSKEADKKAIKHKTDAHDSYAIAKVVLNELDSLPSVEEENTVYHLIRQLMTRRTKLTSQSTSIKNQLHTQLNFHYHNYNKFFSSITVKTALEFWYQYPSAKSFENVTIQELGQFLKRVSNNNLSEERATFILDTIKNDGDIYNHDDVRCFLIKDFIEDYRFKMYEIDKIDNKLKGLIDSLGLHLDTIYGIDFVTTAELVAEIGDINRFKTARKLAKYSGVSPITYSSGDTDKKKPNRQGNRKLRTILFNLAVRQIQVTRGTKEPRNPIMYEYYQRKISEGKTKTQALVYVSRRLVNIIFAMMKHKTAYCTDNSVSKQAS
ncbi:IS110 family transposase [Vallitalea sp.]|jgi:transposase|uniref:IS110 family transposase n=1 Tax=Vallitalea sp. TaxID=1882829 RepID=UPI0025D67ACB|nr:IS110 family transposase [Vallitalea sp.]MCT4687470.1 IS110 family transposase [Vallitalea sp.]